MPPKLVSVDDLYTRTFLDPVADLPAVVADVDKTQSTSYQLGQYTAAPRRADPYFAGQSGHSDIVALITAVDAVALMFQKGGNHSKL